MRLRQLGAAVAAVAIAAAGVMVATPASANGSPSLIIANTRTGTNPIVSGGAGTEFTVVVSNPHAYPVEAVIGGSFEPGLIGESITGLTCSILGPTFACPDPGPTIPANGSLQLTVKAKASPWFSGSTLQMCSWARGMYNGPSTAPNKGDLNYVDPCATDAAASAANGADPTQKAVASVDVKQETDLELTVDQPGQTDPGKQVKVTFTVVERGPSNPGVVRVRTTLPTGLTYVSAAPPWTCTATGQDVECVYSLVPTRASNAPVNKPFDGVPALEVTLNTANPGTVASYAVSGQATSDAADPTPDNATAKTSVPVTPVVYELTKTAGGPYRVGDKVDWTLSVTSKGTFDDAGEITVTDKLPATVKFVSASGDGWTCTADGQALTCKHAGLAVGQTSQAIITTKMLAAGEITNSAALATVSYLSTSSVSKASDAVMVRRLPQSATPLPSSPERIKSGRTDQGQKLATTVRCSPYVAGAVGEVSFCKVTRKGDVVRVKVLGNRKVVVRVVQRAPGTKRYRPYISAEKYIVRP